MSLKDATYVFVRHDAVKDPLQRPYDRPFLVVKRNEKYFTVNKTGIYHTVSLDRLKLAYIDQEPSKQPPRQPSAPAPTTKVSASIPPPVPMLIPTLSTKTRSGRAVNYEGGGGTSFEQTNRTLCMI